MPKGLLSNHEPIGKGITVAILDSGVDPCPDLEGAVIYFHDLVNGKKDAYDDYGHGTHCIGVIAGRGRLNPDYTGIAPGCKLLVVKVLDEKGRGKEATIIRGINWCVEHREDFAIRVINLSLGGTATTSWMEDPLCLAAKNAWMAGIVVCTPAGNEGCKGKGSIRSPGIHPMVITVGAVNRAGAVASFSGLGPTPDGLIKPDLVAPGERIVGLRARGSYLDRIHPGCRIDQNYFHQTGTSVATAIVSGTVACLLEANPILSPDGVKNILLHTTVDLTGEPHEKQGHGLLQSRAVISQAEEFYYLGARPIYLRRPRILTGNDVHLLQKRLRQEGVRLERIKPGTYDSPTWTAARSFQQHYGLNPTGILRDESFSLLGEPVLLHSDKKHFGERILSLGMYGYDVWVLQNKLNLFGFGSLKSVTGYFDLATQSALTHLQNQNGILPANGLMGYETYRFMEERGSLGGRTLVPGTKGADVRELQRRLRRLSIFHGPLDGYYGPETEKAITILQADGNTDPFGICSKGGFWQLGLRDTRVPKGND